MNDLLAQVLESNGGLARWAEVDTLTARVTLGGPVWASRGWPQAAGEKTYEISARREHAVMSRFVTDDQHLVFDPALISIQDDENGTVEELADPRSSFCGSALTGLWTAPQTAYFLGYAMWNYLTAPFLLSYPGVSTQVLEPWVEDGQSWQRLQVSFPDSIATHNTEQVFYFDDAGRQQRHDYAPDIMGSPTSAHYTDRHQTFDGLVFPTRRRVVRRLPDGTTDRSRVAISIDVHDIKIN
jgi:hypothetical protein